MGLLIPIDGSEQSKQAIEFATDTFQPETVTLIHVIDPVEAGYSTGMTMPGSSEDQFETRKEEANTLFEEANSLLEGVSVETVIEVGRPSRAIVSYIE
ncbi:MAG: universal stress protein, partial [Halobacteriaceae archaeon]